MKFKSCSHMMSALTFQVSKEGLKMSRLYHHAELAGEPPLLMDIDAIILICDMCPLFFGTKSP